MSKEREVPVEVNRNGVLLVLVGPTGVGKDTVMRGMFEADEGFEKLVTVTSRNKRDEEIRGWDYHFISRYAFEKMIEQGDFLEYVNYGKNSERPDYKGTLKGSILKVLEGERVIWRIDMGAASRVREILKGGLTEKEYAAVEGRIVVLLVGVRSLFELRARVRDRDGEDYDRQKFLDRMRADWQVWRESEFENMVYNDPERVDEAVRQIIELVNKVELGDEKTG